MTFVLVFVNLLLRVAITIVVLLLVLWLIGILYGVVASALGVPHETAYAFVTHAFDAVTATFARFVDYVRGL